MTDIIVYGRGKTGQSVMSLLQKLHQSAVFYDDVKGFDRGGFTSGGLVVLSPGIPPTAKGVIEARKIGAQFCCELELCFPLCRGKCISVTGTNGKTTVCEMIHHILRCVGKKSVLLGNGGVPFSSRVLDVSYDETVVLESSSFQLAFCKKFAPYISVLTNVASDHLNWHGTVQNYRSAKANNFLRQQDGFAIFNGDDENVVALSEKCRSVKLFYSLRDNDANCSFDGEFVTVKTKDIRCKRQAKFLKNFALHNQSNALAAISACVCAGVCLADCLRALQTFRLSPHRLQKISSFCGVDFVDDSKATNVHATVSALKCFSQDLALILGGSDKGESYDEIFLNLPPDSVVTAAGQTASDIRQCGGKYGVEVRVFDDIKKAVTYCFYALKGRGGTVLMSNACASFDSFGGFEERGEYFAKAVEELKVENTEI